MLVDQKPADVSTDRDKREHTNRHRSRTNSTASVADKTVTDPVCGMTVDPPATNTNIKASLEIPRSASPLCVPKTLSALMR